MTVRRASCLFLLLSVLYASGAIFEIPNGGAGGARRRRGGDACAPTETPDELIPAVASGKECVLRCLAADRCRRVNYLVEERTCKLFSNSTGGFSPPPQPLLPSHVVSSDDCVVYRIKDTKEVCPDGFVRILELQTCLRTLRTNVPWDTARSYCNALHPSSHLLVVNSTLVQRVVSEFVQTKLYPEFPNCFASNHSLLWTAGQRIDPLRKTRFVWRPFPGVQSEFSAETDRLWYPGEPNFEGGTESCVHLWKSNMLNDVKCDRGGCPLCQAEPGFESG